MKEFIDILPVLSPLLILDACLAIYSIVHIVKHPHVRIGNRWIWILIVVFVQLFGPMLYFVFGKGEDRE